jgi:hypothetical protein
VKLGKRFHPHMQEWHHPFESFSILNLACFDRFKHMMKVKAW